MQLLPIIFKPQRWHRKGPKSQTGRSQPRTMARCQDGRKSMYLGFCHSFRSLCFTIVSSPVSIFFYCYRSTGLQRLSDDRAALNAASRQTSEKPARSFSSVDDPMKFLLVPELTNAGYWLPCKHLSLRGPSRQLPRTCSERQWDSSSKWQPWYCHFSADTALNMTPTLTVSQGCTIGHVQSKTGGNI